MYEFNAILKANQTIEITSNTYWSCKAEGNFKLSKYDGSGNTIINIVIPDNVIYAEGIVYFSYGDERCEYIAVDVNLANECYVSTNPNYVLCDDENTINLFFHESGETFYVSVFCYDGWTVGNVTNLSYITSENEVMIISGNDNGELNIIPTHNCDGRNVIHVKLRH